MRWSTDDWAAALRDLLGDLHQPGVDAPPNFAVVVGQRRDGRRDKHTLYRANRRVLRSRSTGRVLRALVRGLAEHDVGAAPPGSVDLHATVLLAADGAIVVDGDLAWTFDETGPKLAGAGLGIVDTGLVRVHLASRDLDLSLPGSWQDRWRSAAIPGDTPDRFEATLDGLRHPLRRIVVGRHRIADESVPPVVAALSLITGSDPVSPDDLTLWIDSMSGLDVRTVTPIPDDVAVAVL